MTTLSVDVSGSIGQFSIEARFQAGAGVTALLGASGAGKSTVLRAIAGLWLPASGCITLDADVFFDDQTRIHVAPHLRGMGIVFQEPRLFPHLSVRDNLLYSPRHTISQLDEIVALLDLGALVHRMPKTLSGGEAQRVALGRALISRPRLLLMDEPMTGLDEDRREHVFPYLINLKKEARVPIIYVSHRREEVERLADRIIVIDNGRLIDGVWPADEQEELT